MLSSIILYILLVVTVGAVELFETGFKQEKTLSCRLQEKGAVFYGFYNEARA